jgi:hypothetical protein
MKKKLEELMNAQGDHREYSAVRPHIYQERFIKTMKKIF